MDIEHVTSQSDDDFADLLERVRQGDEPAASELVQRYERTVLRSVRIRLGSQMRSVLDSMDIVQSVHRSLLVGLRNEKYQFASPQQLVALAVVMVQRKVARHWRKLKQMPSSHFELNYDNEGIPVDRRASSDPTASRIVSAADLLSQFLSQLNEFDRQLVRLKLDGHSSVETARILDREPAFIRMRWTRLRQTLRASGYSS
ncbi:MAG: ECF-type sigma factor [Pirellula sp.]